MAVHEKISLLLLVSLIVYAAFFTEKDRLDREVKRLCAIDGGIKVYETVKLPAERFDRYGQIQIPAKWLAKPEDEYYYEGATSYLIKGNPELLQLHTRMYHESGNTSLRESTLYVRRGGDLPGPWQPSSMRCPQSKNLSDYIFIPISEEGS